MAKLPKWAINKAKYDKDYSKANIKSCTVRLNKNTEPELVEVFESIPDKANWFRSCLRQYAKEHGIEL